ncbi:MAG: type II toxin-antitoxin system HicB family antitoxin [Chloroflexota bacterium]|nr:type II toxin-antitoxin system HicB family antitoxin [Chloroflexota bacterium]MYD50538.1 type II toxin-antitoxin system HicB family antitoxin [Dehalococcoidia bacterium]
MLRNYTARYVKIDSGYMGQLVEWPEVVTEGADLEDCRYMLRDALNEMLLAYQQQGKEVPLGDSLIEHVPVEVAGVG